MTALDSAICYGALKSRDPRFDGKFFTGVKTTGIYCRPICPAKTPQRKNVRFFACAAAAEEAGFRPCMRCRPETSPGTPAWAGTSASVSRALRLIESGVLDGGGVDELAGRLGMTARHLRRLFDEHLGASPVALAQARRVHFARTLLDDTSLPVTQVALASGFTSVRRFNDVFRRTFGRSPSDVRRRRAARNDGEPLTLRLAVRAPFDWSRMLAFIAPRAIGGVESVGDGLYRRTVVFGEDVGTVTVGYADERLVLTVDPALALHLQTIGTRVRRLFDAGADPVTISAHLGADPMLRPLVERFPGTRVPGAWDGFETSVRAILGQQVSVKGATTLASRLVAKYGTPLDDGRYLFPDPGRLARARLETIGLPGTRARALRAFAGAVAAGRLTFATGAGLDETVETLQRLPGFGPWTAHYLAMRVYGEPDAFPSGDLALQRAMRARDNGLDSERRLLARAEPWRPWRAYATMLLWSSITDERYV